MTVIALALLITASFTHAYWNFLAKKANGGIALVWLIYVASTIIFLPIALWVFFTYNVNLTLAFAGVCIVSGGLRLLYFILLQTGYQKADLSIVYPLARGSAPLVSTLGAVVLMGEQITLLSVAGLLLIIAGVIVISRPKIADPHKLRSGIIYGLLTGLMIAIYTLWDKVAISTYKIAPVLLTFASNIMGAVLLIPLTYNKTAELTHELSKHRWHIIAISILSPVSYILVLMAMRTTDIVYVAPVREVSILFGVFMGGRLMAEEDTKRRLVASALILAGVIVLSI
jgi:drug/metabolite transporter (DMT)-like permease